MLFLCSFFFFPPSFYYLCAKITMMKYQVIPFKAFGTTAETSFFETENGTKEWHVMLHVEPSKGGFQEQYEAICKSIVELLSLTSFEGAKLLFQRYFLSDIINQAPLLKTSKVATSIIGQAPLDGSKIAVWMYLNNIGLHHEGYTHLFTSNYISQAENSELQTRDVLQSYTQKLQESGCTLKEDCIRTWFFVRDVDTQYEGLVKARREFFEKHDLTAQTHYLSSTGIGGFPLDTKAIVQMDAYAIKGLVAGQQEYLYGKSHLNATYEYGVTFERGTKVKYGDRNHLFISGTASIDNKGNVMHLGNIEKQTRRMWENVETLLKEGGSGSENIAQIIVYLRDTADYECVKNMFNEHFPHVPKVITLAPVCRPTWLIEMECIVVNAAKNTEYRPF